MKKPIAIALLMSTSAPALAAGSAQTLVTGTLDQLCSVTAPGTQAFDPASTATQPVGDVSYQCNFTGSAVLRLWSLNGGAVVAPASASNGNTAQSRSYGTTFDGTALAQLTDAASSATPVMRTVTAPNIAQTGLTQLRLASAATVAGTYTDTIFVSIAP